MSFPFSGIWVASPAMAAFPPCLCLLSEIPSFQWSWMHSSSCQPTLASGVWGTSVSPLAPSTVLSPCCCYTILWLLSISIICVVNSHVEFLLFETPRVVSASLSGPRGIQQEGPCDPASQVGKASPGRDRSSRGLMSEGDFWAPEMSKHKWSKGEGEH